MAANDALSPLTLEQKWTVIRANVTAWYEHSAAVAGHEITHLNDDVLLTSEHATIPDESAVLGGDGEVIDRMLDWYRRQVPPRPAIIWCLNAAAPSPMLNARMLARGVSTNWKPHWMWCDLDDDGDSGGPVKPAVLGAQYELRVLEPAKMSGLPDTMRDRSGAEAETEPQCRVWHIGAFRGQERVGQCSLNITVTPGDGVVVGGLFDMEVNEAERRQGIGSALTAAACKLGREKGCLHIFLNATEMGESVYRRVGFTSLGHGHTWHLPASFASKPVPNTAQIALLEAVAQGDVALLERVGRQLTTTQLSEPTANEMTPLQLAVHCEQRGSAAWLIEYGVVPDVISLWDLGWKDKAKELVTQRPELVNQVLGQEKRTPLHIAVERDDIELVRLLLTVPNDLSIKDAVFSSTTLGWAVFLEREEIRKLIQQHVS